VVGIVVVSHSSQLADAVVRLAREMGGEDVVVTAAGGLAEEPDAIGTDVTLVMDAIQRSDSGDGVLVLMDLGSAVLSAEMARDMLDEAADRVLLSDAPVVEGAVAAAAVARLGKGLDEVATEALGATRAKAAHLRSPTDEHQPSEAVTIEAPDALEARINVRNRLGLHARPAARFVQTAGRFDARITVSNATTGTGPESATSLNGVAILGARRGHQIVVRATGGEAAAAIAALEDLARENFGDVEADEAEVPATRADATAEPGVITGIAASPGVAVGPARLFRRRRPRLPDGPAQDPDAEWSALMAAIGRARVDIAGARRAASRGAGEQEAAIFDAHSLYLEDEALLEPARRAIFNEKETAARAWDAAVHSVAGAYETLEDEYQRARAADVLEVGAAVLEHLVEPDESDAVTVDSGILVAADLAARDAVRLDPDITTGIATAAGGPTSHGAILARGLGIPAVVAAGPQLMEITDDMRVVVDGDNGTVLVDPDAEVVADYSDRSARIAADRRAARAAAAEPATTRDGVHIEVMANVGSIADARAAAGAGADGIGLLRTEFLFMDRSEPPDENEQVDVYGEIAAAMDGRPVIVRTLDVGGDKPLEYVDSGREANPFLGRRGIRLMLEEADLFATQLRALLRASSEHEIKIMFPMVSSLEEWRSARDLLERQRADLQAGGRKVAQRVEVGIMVEVPAAALLADLFAQEVAFFSIGTNDLTQYVMAAERGNQYVARLADAVNPAVLKLIRSVTAAAGQRGVPVGVCGEMAADPDAVPALVGLGVSELSVAVPAVATVKQSIRLLDDHSARELAQALVGLESAAAVRTRVGEGGRRDS
jgi:multiphosphoryl transfer protein